jgi:hypothetical protein
MPLTHNATSFLSQFLWREENLREGEDFFFFKIFGPKGVLEEKGFGGEGSASIPARMEGSNCPIVPTALRHKHVGCPFHHE